MQTQRNIRVTPAQHKTLSRTHRVTHIHTHEENKNGAAERAIIKYIREKVH